MCIWMDGSVSYQDEGSYLCNPCQSQDLGSLQQQTFEQSYVLV